MRWEGLEELGYREEGREYIVEGFLNWRETRQRDLVLESQSINTIVFVHKELNCLSCVPSVPYCSND